MLDCGVEMSKVCVAAQQMLDFSVEIAHLDLTIQHL
jgi:hypothetical protein